VRASSSASTSVVSATPIRWKISSACRRRTPACVAWPTAQAQRPKPASACPSSKELAGLCSSALGGEHPNLPQTGSSSSKPGKRQLQSSRRAGGRHSGDKDLGRGRSVGRRTWACTSEGAQARAEQVDDVLGAGVAQRLGSEQVP
jgi:hypothetical protein